MRFRQRFVPFGTAFQADEGEARADAGSAREVLFRNEIVVDVGNTCWGWTDPVARTTETRRIIDHHFERERQYPSASAGVLDLQEEIAAWAREVKDEEIWIVSHEQQDFDALCAITLVEDVIRNGVSDVRGPAKNWYSPRLDLVARRFRWRYDLAGVASVTDQCRQSPVPRHRTLSATMHACEQRGANLGSAEFRRQFFRVVRRELNEGRNGSTDSVLEHAGEFAGEREFLDLQERLYERDLNRAYKTVVSIPVSHHFSAEYERLCRVPLVDEKGSLRAEHLMADNATRPVDGIFLRDPECMLFKQFARQDSENVPIRTRIYFHGNCVFPG